MLACCHVVLLQSNKFTKTVLGTTSDGINEHRLGHVMLTLHFVEMCVLKVATMLQYTIRRVIGPFLDMPLLDCQCMASQLTDWTHCGLESLQASRDADWSLENATVNK